MCLYVGDYSLFVEGRAYHTHTYTHLLQLSTSAANELAIEEELDKIATTWETVDLVVMPYKGEHYKLVKTDDVFTLLEGACRASYVWAFREKCLFFPLLSLRLSLSD